MTARTPEELDTLVEDAFVLRDLAVVDALFADDALLVACGERIGATVAELWARDCTYVACSRRVLRTRDLALVVGDTGIHVLRRERDGAWRAAISLLNLGSEDA